MIRSEINILWCDKTISSQSSGNRFREIFTSDPQKIYFKSNNLHILHNHGVQFKDFGNFHCYILGELYELDENDNCLSLIESSTKNIINTLLNLNGSFIILVVDNTSEEFYIVTDRINSKKIFCYQNQHLIALTTNPKYLTCLEQEINIAGVASSLINGVIYNNNTLFNNTKVLERACLHTFSDSRVISKPYWKYVFTNEYSEIPRAELRKKLATLLMQSVQRRIESIKPETCFLSLSGGYDSRFLLGALRSLDSEIRLRTFSYGMSDKLSMGDDVVATQLAKKFKFKHHFEPAYRSNLINIISLNAKYGFGLSNFCSEIDAWLNLNSKFAENPSSMLFVGDMYYLPSYNFGKVKDKRVLLMYSTVFSWQFLKPLLAVLPQTNQQLLMNSYNEFYQGIVDRLPETDDFQVLKDFTYVDQRISHTLMYWRDFFHGPFIKVTQPLLDNDILDFIRRLPNELRYDKILYKETLREMFPDLFEIPIAQNIWANPSWIAEIESNKKQILHDITHSESKLDKLIPIESLISIVNNDRIVKNKFNVSKGIGIARKLSRKNDVLNDLFGNIIIKNTHIKRNQLILRLLLLRKVLQF